MNCVKERKENYFKRRTFHLFLSIRIRVKDVDKEQLKLIDKYYHSCSCFTLSYHVSLYSTLHFLWMNKKGVKKEWQKFYFIM